MCVHKGTLLSLTFEIISRYWIDIWPESTDPAKFVFEELSIAAYLICLFEQEQQQRNLPKYVRESRMVVCLVGMFSNMFSGVWCVCVLKVLYVMSEQVYLLLFTFAIFFRKQSFVDLGCGNGFLVYVLCNVRMLHSFCCCLSLYFSEAAVLYDLV